MNDLNLPKYVRAAINAAHGSINATRWPIRCQRTQKYLTHKLGLFTGGGDNYYELPSAHINFCWNIQQWYVVGVRP